MHLHFFKNHIIRRVLSLNYQQFRFNSKVNIASIQLSFAKESYLKRISRDPVKMASESRGKKKGQGMDTSLDKPGTAKWHLKRTFQLLREMKEEEMGEKAQAEFTPKTEFVEESKKPGWTCYIHLAYPSKMTFKGCDSKKTSAEDKASRDAVLFLQKKGVLDYDLKLVLHEEKKEKESQKKHMVMDAPLFVHPFSTGQLGMMNKFIEDYNLRYKSIINDFLQSRLDENDDEGTIYFPGAECIDAYFEKANTFNGSSFQNTIYSLISGRPLKKLTDFERKKINNYFREFMQNRPKQLEADREFAKLRANVTSLPIHAVKENILDLIFDNQVVVISGETGCGKTTQIPQMILEDMISQDYGAGCSILITQPRRLAAISVAEQTAIQFGEGNVGTSFGYHVRFDKMLPFRDYGSVLFCTTGILLRKMSRNPYLLGISHLIIDEVHEREFLVDIIFVLLKKVLEKNQHIKIILMSASLNAEQFSQYFNNCPIFHVPGRCFPVKQYYLNDIERMVESASKLTGKVQNRINADVIADLINYINTSKKDNASILCFLPGWTDIKQVEDILLRRDTSDWRGGKHNRLSIIPVHSMLSSAQQKEIFKPLQQGVRKVILSTNIAETSLTAPDVVYVIDPGLCNEIFYQKDFNVSTFGTHLISQANAKQREGRAGRVREGVCFKLYTEETQRLIMQQFPVPEILRIPLESVIMLSKLYWPKGSVQEFLGKTMQPPSSDAVEAAVDTLKSINVLQEDEQLTNLGKKIIDFTTHPRLSVCLVNAAMLGCAKSMLNLTAMLSQTRDPFNIPLENRSATVRQIKAQLSNDYLSDFSVMIEIMNDWEMNRDAHGFTDSNQKYYIDAINKLQTSSGDCRKVRYSDYLSHVAMTSAMNLKKQYTENMLECGLLSRDLDSLNIDTEERNRSKCLMGISLASGLYPNILKSGTNAKSKKSFALIDVKTGHSATYTNESLMSNAKLETDALNLCSIYFNCIFLEDRRRLMIKDAAIIPPLYILLVIGKKIHIHNEKQHHCEISLDNSRFLTFLVSKQDLQLILKWKEIFYMYQQWFLLSDKNSTDSRFLFIKNTYKKFVDLTFELFERFSKVH